MCGRIVQNSGPVRLSIIEGIETPDSRDRKPRWNLAPSQDALVIRQNHETGVRTIEPLQWGLIPYWTKDPKGGRKPIIARAETVSKLPMFRDAYAKRRCIIPIDAFYEWKTVEGQRTKQPFAIARANEKPFGLGGIWENWKIPGTDDWLRTFAIITTPANVTVSPIHDRMPLMIDPSNAERWLGPDLDPHDILENEFPPDQLKAWPISTRVNSPKNDDAGIIGPLSKARTSSP